jgi:hypothetical protein
MLIKVLVNSFNAATANRSNISTSDRPYQVVPPKFFLVLAREKM